MKKNGWRAFSLSLIVLTTLAVMPLGHQALACGGEMNHNAMKDPSHHAGGYGSNPYGANPGGNPGHPGPHGTPGTMHGQPNPGTWGPGATPPAGQVPPGQPQDHQGHHN